MPDNAAMESLVSPLRTERTGRKKYRTRDEARVMCLTTSSASTIRNARHALIGS
jgi:hypothetical protein